MAFLLKEGFQWDMDEISPLLSLLCSQDLTGNLDRKI